MPNYTARQRKLSDAEIVELYRQGRDAETIESIKIRGVTWPALRKAGRLELVSH